MICGTVSHDMCLQRHAWSQPGPVKSRPGGGMEPERGSASHGLQLGKKPEDIHVLLVDDEKLSRVVVGNLLRKCNYQGAVREVQRCCGANTKPLITPLAHDKMLCICFNNH